ncbi:MAG TPA: phage regulatory CII family protein [Vicinamibacterales bacterium]
MNGYQSALTSIVQDSHDEHGRRLTIARIADRMGERESYLGPRISPHNKQHTLPATKVVALTNASGNDALVRHICEETGHVAVKLPKVAPGNIDVVEYSTRSVKEFGEMLVQAGLSASRGKATKEGAIAFRKEGSDVIAVITQFMNWMDEQAGITPPQTLTLVVEKERA